MRLDEKQVADWSIDRSAACLFHIFKLWANTSINLIDKIM